MKYQLVLQLPFASDPDYDRLAAFEETIEGGLGELGIPDGHDLGPREMNMFIHTDHPNSAFDRAKFLLDSRDDQRKLKAGYRTFDQDEYVPIYLSEVKHFLLPRVHSFPRQC